MTSCPSCSRNLRLGAALVTISACVLGLALVAGAAAGYAVWYALEALAR